ncbi:MAG TPA: signal peptidase I [Acidobacteriaceae bacterium]|jgi:signal peptidase I|nr:signal peptidase I [Acidobacteriaceae bacterium]
MSEPSMQPLPETTQTDPIQGEPATASDGDRAITAPGQSSHTGWHLHHHYVYPQGFLGMAQTMMTILVIAMFILTFLAQPYRIPSASMEDTLLVGDFLLVNKTIFSPPGIWRHLLPYRNIRHDDVIVFHYPIDASMHLVKRVIGLPGDHIRLQAGQVLVNDTLVPEPFAIHIPSFPSTFRDNFPSQLYTDPGVNTHWWVQMRHDVRNGELVIPANMYFVLGDNRNDSLDSRYWGFVPRKNIVGQPFLVYFSLRGTAPSEITGLPSDRLTHEHKWWAQLAGSARWDRMFHIIR